MTRPSTNEPDRHKLVSLRRVSGAGLANVLYYIIQSLLFLVMTPLVLKALGLEVYGLWTIMAAITGFANLANFGMGAGITKYISEFSVDREASAKISAVLTFGCLFLLLSGILTGLLLFFLRHWISARMIHQAGDATQLAEALAIIAGGITIIFLSQVPKGILFGLVYHKVVGGIDVAQSVAIFLAALIIGLNGGGIVPLALSLIIVNLAFLIILIGIAFRVTRPFSLHFSLNRGLIRQILHYTLFAWFSSLGSILFTQADRVLVAMLLGPAAAGAYAICSGVAARLNALASSATQALVPLASSYKALGKDSEIIKYFLHVTRLIACLIAALGLLLILWGKRILGLWISPDFAQAYGSVFVILIIAYVLFSMASPGYYIAFGLGRPEIAALANVGGALLTLLLIALLSPRFGLTGAAMANVIYFLQIAILFFAGKQLGLSNSTAVTRAILPPIAIIILAILAHQFYNSYISLLFLITAALLILLSWLSLNNGRFALLLSFLKKP